MTELEELRLAYAECSRQRFELLAKLKNLLQEPKPVAHTLSCVCGAVWDIKTDGSEEMVHTPDPSPPKRKPLTHPQIHELDWPDGVPFEDILLFARAIEAAHGIFANAQNKGEA